MYSCLLAEIMAALHHLEKQPEITNYFLSSTMFGKSLIIRLFNDGDV
jgi:hypothetical protein